MRGLEHAQHNESARPRADAEERRSHEPGSRNIDMRAPLLATSCTSPSDRPTRPEPTRKPITSEASSTIRPLVALQMPAPTDESKADQQETAVEPERAVLTRRANAQQNPPGENGTRMGPPLRIRLTRPVIAPFQPPKSERGTGRTDDSPLANPAHTPTVVEKEDHPGRSCGQSARPAGRTGSSPAYQNEMRRA